MICIQAIASTQRATPIEAWDDVIGLLKALKSIGRQEKPESQFELKEEGGLIQLQRGERNQLVDFIKSGQWLPGALEKVKPTKLWIEGLQETDDSQSPQKSGPKLEGAGRKK